MLLGSVLATTGVAHAQAPVPVAEASEDTGEIIVTATRRAEPLQRVPIAVSVIDGDTLRAGNLNNLRDIATQVPTLNFRTAASNKDQALFLRGIGTVSTSPGVEPSVSTVLDGVVLARQGQATLDLLEVERIEVLRGPQGTLFGKNASAGVLNIVTRAPTYDTGGFVDLGYFSGGDEFRGRGGVNLTLSPDKVAASILVAGSTYRGNVLNIFNNEIVNGYERLGARARLRIDASDTVRVLITADYSYSKDTTPQGVVTRTFLTAYPTNVVSNFPAFATAVAPVVASEFNRQINSNYKTQATDDNYGLSAQIDIEVADHTLTSITAWRGWRNTQLQDQDRLPRAIIGFPQQHDVGNLKFDQVSQELRVASPKGGTFDYVFGGFFFQGKNREIYRRDTTVVTATTSTLNTGIADYGVTNRSFAVFAEGNVNFTPGLRGLAGLRVTRDELSYRFARTSTSAVAVPGIQTAFVAGGSTSATGYSGRAGLQVDVTPRVMLYGTYSRGYKGPAYNPAFSMLPQDTLALNPETSDAFELGLKSRLFQNALTLNIAAFLDKLENYQVPFFDTFNNSPVTRLVNAGKVSTRGIEVDASLRPTRGLTIGGALAYTIARIDAFTCPVGTNASCQVNGQPLPFAPKWKGTIRADYTLPIGDSIDLVFGTDFSWQSTVQYSINQTPDTIQSGYQTWNGRFGLSLRDGLSVNLLIKNITDRSYSPFLTRFGSGVVRFVPRDERRYVGINVRKEF